MKGDKGFFEIIQQNQKILHKVCFLYTNNKEDREDLLQEITIQLWKGYKSFRGESKITTWMYKVALNTAISNFRKFSKYNTRIDLQEQIPEYKDETEHIEYEGLHYEMLKHAINLLSDVDKALIILWLEDYSYDEIADIAGISYNNAKVKISRIKSKIKEQINKQRYGK